MPKHTQLINDAIRSLPVHSEYIIDRRTYSSADSYNKVIESNDKRYEYAFKSHKKWPGAESYVQWVEEKLPLEINGHLQDYGQGENKLINARPDLFLDLEVKDEYERYHLPHLDHYPIPESLGGLTVYENCKIRTASSNVMRGNNKDDDQLAYSLFLLAEEFGVSNKVKQLLK
jgi:hypothetical protein